MPLRRKQGCSADITLIPVSYTHLDVYKRQFETFVDVHSNIFEEYLSSVIGKLPKDNEDYRAVCDKIQAIYEQYPRVFAVFDTEKASDLTKEECQALIEVLELKNKLTDMEMQTVYFRGCYDGVGYLKKAGIL